MWDKDFQIVTFGEYHTAMAFAISIYVHYEINLWIDLLIFV